MRFSSVLLALPFIASVFGAPAALAKKDELAVVERGEAVSVLSIFAELKATVESCGPITEVTAEVDVAVVLTTISKGVDKCKSSLASIGVNVEAGVGISLRKRGVPIGGTPNEVAELAADVLHLLDSLVDKISEDVKELKAIDSLICSIELALGQILTGLEIVVAGLLNLVSGLLHDLGLGGLLNGLLSALRV